MSEYTLEAHQLVSSRPGLANEIARILSARNVDKAPKSKVGLTRKMRDLLEFLRDYTRDEDGVPPSYQEMADYLGLASKSGVHRLIAALEERGYIIRMPHHARAIAVIDRQEEK